MRPRSRRPVLVLLAALLAGLTAVPARAAAPAAEQRVVRGSDGYLFIAQDWSVPCQDAGQAQATAGRMAGFVSAVRASGRGATIVLGPDKGSLRTGNLPRSVPLRACGDTEKAAVQRAVAERLGPDALDLRRDLAGTGARWQVYWRQDTHWTPTGGVVYGARLAAHLDPELARHLTTRTVDYTRRGDLANVLGISGRERVTGLQLVNPRVAVQELAHGDRGVGLGSRHTVATPTVDTARVVPGRTLFLGDSFTGTVVDQLAPLFADATYLWPDGDTTPQELADRIARADRVVVMRVERFSAQWRPYDADVVRALAQLPQRAGAPVS